eukprot:9480212-Alexandrium_andersonii.AAC.1
MQCCEASEMDAVLMKSGITNPADQDLEGATAAKAAPQQAPIQAQQAHFIVVHCAGLKIASPLGEQGLFGTPCCPWHASSPTLHTASMLDALACRQ